MRAFIQSGAWRIGLLEPQCSKLYTWSPLWPLHSIHLNKCCNFFFVSYFVLFFFSSSLKPHIAADHAGKSLSYFQWKFKMNHILLPKCLWKPLWYKLSLNHLSLHEKSHAIMWQDIIFPWYSCISFGSNYWHNMNKNLRCSTLSLTFYLWWDQTLTHCSLSVNIEINKIDQ